MTLETLFARFEERFPECAVFYDHIETDENQEVYPPIVLIHETNGKPLHADNRTYWIGIENRIEVLQVERDVEFRKEIMDFLNENGISFDVSFDDFDDSLMLYQDSYYLDLDE